MKCPVCETSVNVATSITHSVYAHHCPAAGVPIYWNQDAVFSNNPGLKGKVRNANRDSTGDERVHQQSLGRISGGVSKIRQARDKALSRSSQRRSSSARPNLYVVGVQNESSNQRLLGQSTVTPDGAA